MELTSTPPTTSPVNAPQDPLPELTDSQHQHLGFARSHTKLFWTIAVVFLVLGLLGIIYLYTINQFTTNVTVNHAEHGRTSPAVHEIVHVRQVLKVGVGNNLPPMAFESNGSLSGYEIDLARAIAGELNVPVEFVHYDYRDATAGTQIDRNNPLDKDEIDLIINSLVTTPSREQMYSFSGPYLESGQVLLTKATDTSITQLSDLAGKRVAVEENTTGHELLTTFNQAEIVTIDTLDEAVAALKNNSVVAAITDAPFAQSIVATNTDLHIATDLLTHEEYAIAIRRDKDDLSGEIDTILERLRQKGVIESLRQKWLN